MADFDVIVVGAGVCGTSAAIRMQSQGLNVLLVDRGKPIGSKNLSGGALWGHDLADVLGEHWYQEGLEAGAIERPLTQKGVNFLTKDSGFTAKFGTKDWAKPPYNAFTVLRAKFDAWLAGKAAEKGVTVVHGINIEHLATENRHGHLWVTGVQQEGAVITSDCVLMADGANSRLTMDLGLRGKLDRKSYVLGVKEVISLPEKTIEDRFGLGGPLEGAAHEYVLGYLENGAKAGGFLYTNKDTLSLGVVINLDSIWERGVYTHKIMEDFRVHPSIAPLLRGGEMVEYGAHLIPEAGLNCTPTLYGNGWMVAGDAAGFVYSNGLVIHGMNYAVRSGIIAAEAAAHAKSKGDWSGETLHVYKDMLDESFIMKDLKKFHKMHEFVWNPTIHGVVPGLVEGVFKDLFTATGEPKMFTEEILMKNLKGVSKWQLAKTALEARKSV